MAECHIPKFSPTSSCVQLRTIPEIVVSSVVNNSKGLSVTIFVKVALQYYGGGISSAKLIGESHKSDENSMFKRKQAVVGQKKVNIIWTVVKLIIEKFLKAKIETLRKFLYHNPRKID